MMYRFCKAEQFQLYEIPKRRLPAIIYFDIPEPEIW